jgi:hypothetical protein
MVLVMDSDVEMLQKVSIFLKNITFFSQSHEIYMADLCRYLAGYRAFALMEQWLAVRNLGVKMG